MFACVPCVCVYCLWFNVRCRMIRFVMMLCVCVWIVLLGVLVCFVCDLLCGVVYLLFVGACVCVCDAVCLRVLCSVIKRVLFCLSVIYGVRCCVVCV